MRHRWWAVIVAALLVGVLYLHVAPGPHPASPNCRAELDRWDALALTIAEEGSAGVPADDKLLAQWSKVADRYEACVALWGPPR